MFKMAVGQGECVDTGCATRAAIDAARRSLGGLAPQAGIVFVGEYFEHEEALTEVRAAFPGLALVGCSSSGEMSSSLGFSDDSVVLVLFASDTVRFRAGAVRDFSGRAKEAVEAALAEVADFASGEPGLCLVFPDMALGEATEAVSELDRRLGPDCPVIGGAAGGRMDRSGSSRQYYGAEVLKGAAPFLLFSGAIEYAAGVSRSWRPVGGRGRVSDSRGNRVGRIGDMPALDFYRHYLGPHSTPAFEMPLAVYEKDGERFHIRSPGGYNEKDKSIEFVGGIPEGSVVQLTEVTRAGLEEGVRKAASKLAAHNPGGWRPAGAMVFSCITRKLVLGTRAGQELRLFQEGFPKDVAVAGFYGFGEIGPVRRGGESRFHSCTTTAVLLGEKGAAAKTPPPSAAFRPDAKDYCGPEAADSALALGRENRFLRRKLDRAKVYRERLEYNKDLSGALMRTVNREINEARLEIARKNELLRQAMSLAEEVQRNLLPEKGPGIPGFDIAGASLYSDETGGDYFDFIEAPGGQEGIWSILVGDVTGHGIAAALLMTTVRAFLRMRFSMPGSHVAAITEVNRHVSRDLVGSGRFMTLFSLILDPVKKRMRWVRAGHDRMIAFDPKTGSVADAADAGGLPLGVAGFASYSESELRGLASGQVYLIGTDGIWETHDPERKMFGRERTHAVLRENAGKSAAEINEAMFAAIREFRGRAEREDDATLVVIKVL